MIYEKGSRGGKTGYSKLETEEEPIDEVCLYKYRKLMAKSAQTEALRTAILFLNLNNGNRVNAYFARLYRQQTGQKLGLWKKEVYLGGKLYAPVQNIKVRQDYGEHCSPNVINYLSSEDVALFPKHPSPNDQGKYCKEVVREYCEHLMTLEVPKEQARTIYKFYVQYFESN